MIPERFALLLIKQKNHNKRFGEFEFEYFGGSDVANKLFDSQNTYDIIGFPDFIYLESPVSIPVVQFQAFDNDKNDEIHYSISSQDFTIDEFTGQVYYDSEQYLSEEISAVIKVTLLSYDPDKA